MRKLIIKDYMARKKLEFNFKIHCLTSKSIGRRKEKCPHMYVYMYVCIPEKLSKGFESKDILPFTKFFHMVFDFLNRPAK